MFGGGSEKVTETAKGIGPYSLFFKRAYPEVVKTFLRKHVEMVEPEIHHHFLELSGTFYGSYKACLGSLFQDHTCPLTRALSCLLVALLCGIRGGAILNEEFWCGKSQSRKALESSR